jgi:hypothetical protein
VAHLFFLAIVGGMLCPRGYPLAGSQIATESLHAMERPDSDKLGSGGGILLKAVFSGIGAAAIDNSPRMFIMEVYPSN